MIRSAIIGLGDIAGVHMPAILENPLAMLCAVCDIDESRRAVLPDGVPFYKDYEEMLAKEKPDVVHICLPHYLHYPVAQAVMKHGCAIFAEKPLALNAEEALQYAEEAKRYDHPICLCLQNRFNNTSEKMTELLQSGVYGRILGLYGNMTWTRSLAYYQAKPWRASMKLAGGGCMINQAIHTLDLLQYFAQSPIEQIRGSIAHLQDFDVEVEDTAHARIRFQNGAVGFFAATIANYNDHNVEIIVTCEKAELILRNKALFCSQNGQLTELARDDEAFAGKACYGNSHAKLIDLFYRSLLGEPTEAYPTPADGVVSMQMIDAIRH